MSFLLRNIGDVQKVFEEIKTSIFYITPNADKGVGLEKIIGNYHIICIDYDDEVDYLANSGVNVFCLEKEMGKKNVLFRNSRLLLQQPEVVKYFKNHESPKDKPTGQARIKNHESRIKNKKIAIIVFKPSPSIEKICRANNWLLLNNSVSISQQFEDKLNFYKIAQKLNLPIPKTREINIEKFSYKELKDEFSDFVIQHPSGFAGRTTFFIKSKDDYLRFKKQYKGDKIKISEFIDGLPVTINACVTKFGTVVGEPCYQITGIPVCTNNPATTCGNDWQVLNQKSSFDKASTVSSAEPLRMTLSKVCGEYVESAEGSRLIHDSIKKITQKVGDYMAKTGYKGIFGLDFVLEEKSGRIYHIECNPRIVASIPMATKLEIAAGQIPLLALHILEFLGIDYRYLRLFETSPFVIASDSPIGESRSNPVEIGLNTGLLRRFTPRNDISRQSQSSIQEINGSQLVLRNKNSERCLVNGNFKSGIYKFTPKGLKFVRKGYSVEDIKTNNEFVILSVSKGRLLNPETECARIESKESLLDDNYQLKKWVEIVVKELYRQLELS